MLRKIFLISTACAVTMALSACGLKGDLYLPEAVSEAFFLILR